MRIRTAVIGCGAITRLVHLPSVLQHPSFELVALADTNPEATRKASREYGISVPLVRDIRDLPPTDAAIVAVPPHLHARLGIALLGKGIHVLCEKPMAMDAGEGERMIQAARAGKAVLLIGMQKHYCPSTRLLKDVLEDGMLGGITAFRLVSAVRSQWDTANPNRFHPGHAKGGILFEHGVHWIHRIVNWFGYPKWIGYKDDRIDGVEVNAFVENEFDAYGWTIRGSQLFSWDHDWKNEIAVHGEKGVARVRDDDVSTVFVTREINGRAKVMEIRGDDARNLEPLSVRQLDFFAECIDKKVEVPEPTLLALEAIRFIDECYAKRVAVRQPWVFHGIDRMKAFSPPDPLAAG